MDVLANMIAGFDQALSWSALLACFIGVTLGTFVGVLPGIGPLAGMSLLLPLTFSWGPVEAVVMLAGIYYGAMYGSSTSAILINLPGTIVSAPVCLDGYPMAKQGRAGVALAMTTIASFIGGCLAILLMMFFAVPLTSLGLAISSVEYFGLIILALIAGSTVGAPSPAKGLAMVTIGLLIGTVGTDLNTGTQRFTFGLPALYDGVNLVVLAMGLFGVAEVFARFSEAHGSNRWTAPEVDLRWKALMPSRQDFRDAARPILRGSGIGGVIGTLPGAGAAVASFISYGVEKRISARPERFGKGAIEGLSSAEAANNAAAQAAFIPTMALGIPGSVVMALVLGALMIHGIQPGPLVMSSNPEVFWGLIASFWIGNLMLLVLNLPLIGIWVRMLTIPYHILYPCILFFVCFGAYLSERNIDDVFLVIFFGVLGFALRALSLPVAPILLGVVLGPLLEEHFGRAMLLSRGDPTVFFTQTVSALLLAASVVLIVLSSVAALRRRRSNAGSEIAEEE